jgi:type I restriction enzyme S subunit
MKTLAPRLRFSEFGNDWDFKKLNSIKSKGRKVIKAGPFGSAIKKEFYVKEGYKVYGQEQVINDDAFFGDYYINKTTYNKLKSCDVKPNDILVSLVGTFGKVLLIPENAEEGVINPRLLRLSIPIELILPKFSKQYLKTYIVKKTLISWSQGGTMGVLNAEIVSKLTMPIPSLLEQQKIASFLTDVDDKITKLTKKKVLLEQYKKGLMQKIFNQELRFKDGNGNAFPDWVEKKLGDLGNTLNGLTGKTKENFGSGKPYIQYKQIFDSSKINIDNCGFVDITITDKQTKVKYGDVFFTTSSETPNEIGTASVLLENVEEMYLNSFCFGFRVNQLDLYPSFSQFLFRSIDFRKKMIPLAQGSTRYNISKSAFVKLKVSLPNIEEQTKIANFLSDIDLKIEALNTKIENSKNFKKGLLQQMFV